MKGCNGIYCYRREDYAGGSAFDIKIAQYLNSKLMEFGCLKNYWKDQGEVLNATVTSAEQVRIALSSNRNVMLVLLLSGED